MSFEKSGVVLPRPNRSLANSVRRNFACPELLEQRLNLSGLVISEFVARNATSLLDDDGEASDWIEIQNRSDDSIDLEGWRLSDDSDDVGKWTFPKVTLEASQLLLVYASGKNRRDPMLPLHSNFKLSVQGEYLALVDSDGNVATEFSPNYPRQLTDVSYGIDATGSEVFFESPTPMQANSAARLESVQDVFLDVPSGFYEGALSVRLETATSNAEIFYTTDGSVPARNSGTRYIEPIAIEATTVLRASAFKDGLAPSKDVTQTYIFAKDVASQSVATARDKGFPAEFITDFEMDPRVVGPADQFEGKYAEQLVDSLMAIPTLSLAMETEDFESLIRNVGETLEKATSGEIIFPDTGEVGEFSSGLRVQGGISRSVRPRNSFRMVFREEFGMSKLEYPLFGEDAGNEYDSIILRSSMGELLDNNGVHYIRDAFIRRLQVAMGQPSAQSRFVHLYVNGIYWGMYEATERLDDQFMSNNFGGDKEDWDVLRGDSSVTVANTGDTDAWRRLGRLVRQMSAASPEQNHELYMQIQGRDASGVRDPGLEVLLDVDNYITDLTVHWYGEVNDWLGNNYFIARNRNDSTGFRFFAWDTEYSLFGPRWRANNIKNFGLQQRNGPASIFQGLYSNESFRLRFSDLIQEWTSPGGALYVSAETPNFDPLQPENNVPASLWAELIEEVQLPLVANSARWGDLFADVLPFLPPLRTRDEYWNPLVEAKLSDWFPRRTADFVREISLADLFRNAPFVDEPSGQVPTGQSVNISADGDIYYTLDGSDPRRVNGEPSAAAQVYSQPIRLDSSAMLVTRSRTEEGWSAKETRTFLLDPDVSATSLRISEVHYHPASPTASEIKEGFTRRSDFEFIELQNTSDQTIELSSARLTTSKVIGMNEGVEFDFSESSIQTLGPNEFVVVVNNAAAVRARYGESIPIAGTWFGRLDNRAETINLVVNGVTIQQFRYHDHWYPKTDGGGFSLVVSNIHSSELFKLDEADEWQPSNRIDGSPGRSPFVVGDSNLDDVFDSSDLVKIFQANEYEDSLVGNSTWATGDWSGDGEFTSTDLVIAFQFGTYVRD